MNSEKLTVKEVVKRIRKNEVDLIEWNKSFIENVKNKESRIHAWSHFDESNWLDQCKKLNDEKNNGPDVLYGVPVGVKDIFNTKDMPTEMGSPIWKGFTPGNDARVVHNIRFNKGIVAGKTVTAEFAVHTPNETRNPWNPEYSPGTSSSGSAAAVASGMVPLALATQTAGSTIRPASYCGIFGFKPTFGTLPRTAMLKTTDTLDTIGMFATNAEDCKLLFDVMRVHGLDYPIVHNNLNDDKLQSKLDNKWKVGLITEQIWTNQHTSGYAQKAFCDFIKTLPSDDLITNFPTFDQSFQQAHDKQKLVYHKALSYYFKKEFENKTLISQVMYEIVEEGRKITIEQYKEGLRFQEELSHKMDEMFNDNDVMITLSTAGIAPSFGTAIDPPDTCLIWTMCGLPVINVPMFTHDGLPFGLQIIGKKYTDYKLLSFVKELTDKNILKRFSEVAP